MRTKLIFFTLGLVCGALAVFLFFSYQSGKSLLHSPEERGLSDRIEAIPIESICNSISSGKPILGDDHVTVWSDQKRYVVAGWRVGKAGIPVFYWTGADLPADVPGCTK